MAEGRAEVAAVAHQVTGQALPVEAAHRAGAGGAKGGGHESKRKEAPEVQIQPPGRAPSRKESCSPTPLTCLPQGFQPQPPGISLCGVVWVTRAATEARAPTRTV